MVEPAPTLLTIVRWMIAVIVLLALPAALYYDIGNYLMIRQVADATITPERKPISLTPEQLELLRKRMEE